MLIRLGSNAKNYVSLKEFKDYFIILRLNCIFILFCSMHGSAIRCITIKSGRVLSVSVAVDVKQCIEEIKLSV